jgi:hypothetical protein
MPCNYLQPALEGVRQPNAARRNGANGKWRGRSKERGVRKSRFDPISFTNADWVYSCQKYENPRGSSPPRTGAGLRGIYAAWGPMALLPVLLATRSSFLCRLAFALVLVLVGGSGSRASGSGGVGVSEWEWEWKCKRAACWGWRPTLLQPLSRRRFTSEVGPGVWGVITRLPGLGR